MRRIHIVESFGSENHAGPKAQRDIAEILTKNGWQPFKVWRLASKNPFLKFLGRIIWVVSAWFYRMLIHRGDTIVLQYPGVAFANRATFFLFDEKAKKRLAYKLITIVHDLYDFRDGLHRLTESEQRLFLLSDVVIVHNGGMRDAVSKCGVDKNKLITLNCFDYLSDAAMVESRSYAPNINVAGNLNFNRSGWMQGLVGFEGISWTLFGTNYDPNELNPSKFSYRGCIRAEELPSKLENGFGLIWYGESSDVPRGDIIDYVRIINPHKLSLYLASGLPCIVWAESGVADFVLEHRVGLAINCLTELERAVLEINSDEYARMATNAAIIGNKLLRGEYTLNAVETAIKRIEVG